jgi:hypothetical protein
LIGVRTVSNSGQSKKRATLAEIKKHIQPMLSRRAEKFDLTVMRRKYDNGELSPSWPRPKRGAKNWLSLRSDKRTYTFEIAVAASEGSEYYVAVQEVAKLFEKEIAEIFGQTVPIRISKMPEYIVTSGAHSAEVTVANGSEEDDFF